MLSELIRAAENLGELDPRSIARGDLVDAHMALRRVSAIVDGVSTAVLGVIDADQVYADEAFATAGMCIATLEHLPRVVANVSVKRARDLRSLPETEAALRAGLISTEHVTVLSNVMNPRTYAALLADEAAFVVLAQRLSFEEFRRKVAQWERDQDHDGGHDPGTDASTLYISAGMWGRMLIKGDFSAEDATILRPIFEAETERLWRQETNDSELDPALAPPRATSHRNAEGLLNLLQRAETTDETQIGRGPLAGIGIVITTEELDGHHGGHRLDDAAPIGPGELDRFCCDAGIYRTVLRNGTELLDLGRTVRTATPAQKRALAIRDQGCVVPGCDRPPRDCEAHHVIWYRNGGHTTINNLVLLCRRHHRQTHHHKWHIELRTDQTLKFTKPDGTQLRKPHAA